MIMQWDAHCAIPNVHVPLFNIDNDSFETSRHLACCKQR